MIEKKIQLPIKNFPSQQSIFDAPQRFKIVVKGRRFGLTKGAANNFIEEAIDGKFLRGLWVDTVNSNIDRYVERYFLPHLMKLPKGYWDWRKQAKVLEINNSYIDFRSADNPETLEGFGYDKFFLNEAGIILKNEYLYHNAIKPMLWDYSASGVIGGTPKGIGLFNTLALRGQDPKQTDYAYFHFTSFDNPYLNGEELAKDIANMPSDVVRQEVYAEFIDNNGIVFKNIDTNATARPQKPSPGGQYLMGVDLAKYEDFTVIIVVDTQTNEEVYRDRFNKLDWPYQKAKIASISGFYNNARVYLDSTGLGDPIADDLSRAGVLIEPIKFTNELKKQMVEKLKLWFEMGFYKFIPNKDCDIELKSFSCEVLPSGKLRYAAPDGFHDDEVMAKCLVVWGLYDRIPERKLREPTIIERAKARAIRNYERMYSDEADEIEIIDDDSMD